MSLLTSFKALKEILKPLLKSFNNNNIIIIIILFFFNTAIILPRTRTSTNHLKKATKILSFKATPTSWRTFSSFITTEWLPKCKDSTTPNSQGLRNEAQIVKFEDRQGKKRRRRGEFEDLGRTKLGQFQFEHTGPFEPLVLSLLGGFLSHGFLLLLTAGCLNIKGGSKILYKLYIDNHGGGLGKTIQTIAFLAAIFEKDEESDGQALSVSLYRTNRDLILEKLKAGGVEILITSFDTYRIHGSILSEVDWEGLWGSREHFREFYDEPLKHGQRSTAPESFVRKADKRKEHLVSVLRKYMLRRTKEETIGHLMMGKEDNVVFCSMSELQKR
ncbi:hypothetical protein H0E87_028701, partial [Populus deltoides]